ncbi:MAG TPA: oligosaccharide flippase family protein [Polyangiaceae bacterium]|jgi:O-antigen/teichoic acid export membrane protein|nr:oligosaccharide flippase family protein [Polyangiaceae bacterium]
MSPEPGEISEPATGNAVVRVSAEPTALPGATSPGDTSGLVLKNTLFLLIAQVLGTPLSVLVNAVTARKLGPEDFGYIYLATTFATFGFIVIEWGQSGTLPAMVARDRAHAGEFVGTGLVFRFVMLLGVYPLMAGACWLSGYGAALQAVLALVFLGGFVLSSMGAGTDTVLGFERTDIRAYAMVGQQILMAAIMLPTLLLGGGLRATMTAAVVAAVITCAFVWRAVLRTGLGRFAVRREIVRRQIKEGTPFVALGLVLALQPSVDALLLAKLGTAEAIGWHAASRKLVGVLIFPAAALTNALYPTLCRVFGDDLAAFKRTVGGALRTATVLVVPVALGAALYADVGILIFSRTTFAPAEDNLRILSLFIFLVYFSMTLGSSLAAAGRQRAWAITQFACVAVSAIVDPILIPWFQAHHGNGGLGVCVSTVMSEVLMVAAGIWLSPAGIFDRRVVRGIGLAVVAGGAMVITARLLSGLTPFVAAPIAVIAYFACLILTGGVEKEQLAAVRELLAKKLARFQRA